jgi:hypothetical protein
MLVVSVVASGRAQNLPMPQTASELYTQLRTVGLDKGRVYHVRDAVIDRNSLHISLQDGRIGFTTDICGRITGAFFEGDGEVLLRPPNRNERASLALFTGMAILEEQFSTAYFRFNDDTFEELQPALRPIESAEDFVTEWGGMAQRLAENDALRLLLDFSQFLPVEGVASGPREDLTVLGRLLHARLQGRKLGGIDLYFDASVPDSIWVAQLKTEDQTTYIDTLTSFAPRDTAPKAAPPSSSRRDDVTIGSYRVAVGVRPPSQLDADAQVQLDILRGGKRALLFELSRFLNVRSVELDGKPLEFIHNQALEGSQLARRGNDLIAVVFPRTLQTGQKITLRFTYGGEVISEAGAGLLYVGARGTWYPNLGLAMSNFDLEFHYPAAWTLVATGKPAPVGSSLTKDLAILTAGDQATRWISERPIPVAGFNLGKYERASSVSGSVAVEAYATTGVEKSFPKGQTEVIPMPDMRRPNMPGTALVVTTPPPSPARNAQGVADRSAQAVDFFGKRFGPYPYSSLALTQLPGDLSQGWPGLVFLSSYAFLTEAERQHLRLDPVQSILSSQVLVHEVAHQWWGDLVAWRSYRDQWWVEALANYSSLMMLEQEHPEQFRSVMTKYRDNLFEKNKSGELLKDAGPVTFGGRLSSSRFPNGYEAISYGRGTWLFHMLRSMFREGAIQRPGTAPEDPFLRALRRLRERYQGKLITTEELVGVFEEDLPPSLRYEGKKSLDWFLNGWINGTAVPKLELQGVKYVARENSSLITGKLLQKDAPPDLLTPVPLYGQVGGNSELVFLGQVFADGEETTFRLNAPRRTTKILMDPKQTLLIAK